MINTEGKMDRLCQHSKIRSIFVIQSKTASFMDKDTDHVVSVFFKFNIFLATLFYNMLIFKDYFYVFDEK